jgi:curved DNA-binding protein CbpA
MTPKNALEIEGTFLAHPFVELVAEIAQAQLDGSLRVSNDKKKCVVYFREGRLVFAASNARESRLFEILINSGKLKKENLAQIPNFQNDFELVAWLKSKERLSEAEHERLFKGQIEAIILDILSWQAGIWSFSSLARVREGLDFDMNTTGLFTDYGRCMNAEYVVNRFRSMDECFEATGLDASAAALSPEEAYLLSCATGQAMKLSELVNAAALPQSIILHSVYNLWLGGFLTRSHWQTALSADFVHSMRSAKLELKRQAKIATVVAEPEIIEESSQEHSTDNAVKSKEIVITLDEYLDRVESAATFYDVLGIDSKSEITEIKQAYLSLAKVFHPDKFHTESAETLRRVQHAFAELTRAHDSLKNAESRDVYDYRMRKEIADREKTESLGDEAAKADSQAEQASLSFDRGFSLLLDGDAEAALPFLARAVHYDASVARYHAYYGKALASDESKRHKAEAEIQTAIKLDPESPTFRVLLAEFFIKFNLIKRAQGELTRLLERFPDNREAQKLLDSLQVTA